MHRADKYSQDNPGAISNHEKLCSIKVRVADCMPDEYPNFWKNEK